MARCKKPIKCFMYGALAQQMTNIGLISHNPRYDNRLYCRRISPLRKTFFYRQIHFTLLIPEALDRKIRLMQYEENHAATNILLHSIGKVLWFPITHPSDPHRHNIFSSFYFPRTQMVLTKTLCCVSVQFKRKRSEPKLVCLYDVVSGNCKSYEWQNTSKHFNEN